MFNLWLPIWCLSSFYYCARRGGAPMDKIAPALGCRETDYFIHMGRQSCQGERGRQRCCESSRSCPFRPGIGGASETEMSTGGQEAKQGIRRERDRGHGGRSGPWGGQGHLPCLGRLACRLSCTRSPLCAFDLFNRKEWVMERQRQSFHSGSSKRT